MIENAINELQTPLHVATFEGDSVTAQALTEAGASLNAKAPRLAPA